VSPGVRCSGSGVTRAPAISILRTSTSNKLRLWTGWYSMRKPRNTSFLTHIPRTHPRTHSSYTSLAHIPRLFCMRKNIAPLSRFHQSCADRGEVNEAILLVLYKHISRYASSHISGGNAALRMHAPLLCVVLNKYYEDRVQVFDVFSGILCSFIKHDFCKNAIIFECYSLTYIIVIIIT
jgi:hypothetical protein